MHAAGWAFAALGYHIDAGKADTARRGGVPADRWRRWRRPGSCSPSARHVLRYTPYTRTVKEIADSGLLGDIMSVQHLEPVGFGTRPTPTS